MKNILNVVSTVFLQVSLLLGLVGTAWVPLISMAALPTGTIQNSTDNSTFNFAGNVSAPRDSNLWFRWTAAGSGDCVLWMDNVETNKVYIDSGIAPQTSSSFKIDTATAGSFHYSLRCDDPAVTGTNYVQIAGVNLTVNAPTPSNAPPVIDMWPQTPDCVIGYPKSYVINAYDPNGNPFRFELSRSSFHNGSDVTAYPSASTYFNSGLAGPYSVTYDYPPSPGAGGIWFFPDVRAIDNQGNATEWQDVQEWGGNTGSYDTFTANEQLCVFNLDEGLSGGDNDGTDLVVTVNGTTQSATNINIQTGDQISLKWRSALQQCTGGGPGTFFVGPGYGTAGEDTDVTEPPPGQSYTYVYNCNTIDFQQSETIVVTNTSPATGNVCTGAMPSSAAAYDSEESTSLTSSLAWAYAASDTSRKCEFRCNSGYTWNGSSCDGAPPPPPPPGLSVTLGSTENGVYAEGNRDVGTDSILGVYWSATNSDECYFTWQGVFRGTYVNSGLGTVPVSPGSGGSNLFPPPRNIGDYLVARVSCLDPTRTQEAVQTIRINTTYGGNAPPLPSAGIQASKYSSGVWQPWTNGNLSIAAGELVRVRWSSSNADGCTATAGAGFSTNTSYDFNGNVTSYRYAAVSGTDGSVTPPTNGQSTTYSINCSNDFGSAPASVTVINTTPNTPPAAPTITGPTEGYNQTTYQFSITGTDSDNQNVRYAIDWDNNNTIDQYSSYGASGWQYQPSRSWNTIGIKTFCVQTDDGVALSAKTCHTITLTTIPPISVDLKINGSDGPINVHYSDTMTLSWTVNRTGTCTLTGAGVDYYDNSVTVPPTGTMSIDATEISYVGGDETYVLTCAGTSDSVFVDAISNNLTFEVQENSNPWSMNSITVGSESTVRLRWNWAGPGSCSGTNFNTSGSRSNAGLTVTTPDPGESTTFTIRCNTIYTASITVTTLKSNLTRPIIATPVLSGYDPATGNYSSITLTFRTENNGASATESLADYRFRFDINRDGDFNDVGETVNRGSSIPLLTPGAGTNETETFTGLISPGNHNVQITVDSNNEVDETDETDNVYSQPGNPPITISQPDPGLTITADKTQVGNGETTTIRWSIPAASPTISCQVYGPGLNQNSVAIPGSTSVGPITAKSEYTLKCTDSSTGNTWTKTVIIETAGTIEEV